MVNLAEAWMTPTEIAASRLPDRSFYTDWERDYSVEPIPFKKMRATRIGMWGAVLEQAEEQWEQRTEVRYLIEQWRVPSLRIPVIIEPVRFVAEATGPATISEPRFMIRETESKTVGRKTPEYRTIDVLTRSPR